MAGMNKAIICGRLGADPEVRSFSNGGKVVNLRVATSETWKDKSTGEKKERTEWHSISIMNEGIAGVAEKYLKKGSEVLLEGQIETRKWQDQSGADRYSTEIVLRPFSGSLTLIGGGGRGDSGGGQQDQRPSEGGYGSGGRPDPDEIPFAPQFL